MDTHVGFARNMERMDNGAGFSHRRGRRERGGPQSKTKRGMEGDFQPALMNWKGLSASGEQETQSSLSGALEMRLPASSLLKTATISLDTNQSQAYG